MSFLASFYLWLIPLISIPLIFHLLNRRKYNTVHFSTLKFFLDIEKESLKKVNFTNILLLIIRTLILLFIILIFSDPIINGLSRNKSNNDSNLIKIIVDDSFSNKDFIENNFNTVIKTIAENYPENTYIVIETFNNRIIYDDFIQNISFPINNNFSTYNSYGITKALKNIDNNDYKSFLNKDVFIISDFQKNIFNNFNKTYSDNELDSWNIFIYNHNNNPKNIILTNFSIQNQSIRPDELFNVSIRCTNLMDKRIENEIIEFFINDIKVGDNMLDFNPLEQHNINFETSIPDRGFHKCYISINNYKYFFVINIPKKMKSGLMYENPEDARYIQSLLSVYNELNNNLEIIKINNLSSLNIDDYSVIFKFGTEDLSSHNISKLKNLTNNLIIIPTNSLDLSYFSKDATQVLNITKTNKNPLYLDNTSISNPELKKIFNKDNNNYKIYEYFDSPSNKNTLLSLNNSSALLNQYVDQMSNIYLFTLPMNLESSNIPITGSFIPLLDYMIFNNTNSYNMSIGDDRYFKKTVSNDTIIHKINKNKSYYYNSSYFFNENILFELPGFHTFNFTDQDSLSIAINIKDNEINDDLVSSDDIESYFNDPIIIDDFNELSSTLSTQVSGIYIMRYLLYILIILVLAEMYISNIYIYKND